MSAIGFDWVQSTVEFFSANIEYFGKHPLEFARLCATLPTAAHRQEFRSIAIKAFGPRILQAIEQKERERQSADASGMHPVARALDRLLQLDPMDERVGAVIMSTGLSSQETLLLEDLLHVLQKRRNAM
eukprot:ANDGO_00165.mRNA.1 hypothetical protein